MDDILIWCFQYFYHQDKANAAIHCAPVRFSPITFRLALRFTLTDSPTGDLERAVAEVRSHMGAYEEDKGR
jgi:hypothetical protein